MSGRMTVDQLHRVVDELYRRWPAATVDYLFLKETEVCFVTSHGTITANL